MWEQKLQVKTWKHEKKIIPRGRSIGCSLWQLSQSRKTASFESLDSWWDFKQTNKHLLERQAQWRSYHTKGMQARSLFGGQNNAYWNSPEETCLSEREAIAPHHPNKKIMEIQVLKPGALQFILIKWREVFSPGAGPADGSLWEPAGTPSPPTSGDHRPLLHSPQLWVSVEFI